MSRKIFHELAERVQKAGGTRVLFECNLERFLSGPEPGTGMNLSWCAIAAGDKDQIAQRFGRTGEEAFRALADAVEKKA